MGEEPRDQGGTRQRTSLDGTERVFPASLGGIRCQDELAGACSGRMVAALVALLSPLALGACGSPASGPGAQTASPAPSQVLVNLLPSVEELLPWKISSPPRYFAAEDLWKYINGAAEAYLAEGVVGMVTVEYAPAEGASSIVVEIYQMGTHEGSQAIYRKENGSGGDDVSLGEESTVERGAVAFYQGRYYVKLVTFDFSASSQAALERIASTVAQCIKD